MTALADHVWQSTLLVVLAALIAWTLRSAPHVRYAIWLTASIKFLVPVSLLIALGGHMQVDRPAAVTAPLAAAMTTVSQPFTQLGARPEALAPVDGATSASAIRLVAFAVAAVWLAGCAVLVLVRVRGWRQIARARRDSVELGEGRETDVLRGIERSLRIRRPTALRASAAVIEPAVVGILKPMLLWPASLSSRLSDKEMAAVLIHELTHLRRRDNQTGLIQVIVETIFWFHPLVWWLSARLVDERERACDQAVLASGVEPHAYANGLLTVCKHCLASPLGAVPGITGSDLSRRVERIASGERPRRLRWLERVLLVATTVVVVTVPVAAGMLQADAAQRHVSLDAIVSPIRTLESRFTPEVSSPESAEAAMVQPESSPAAAAAQPTTVTYLSGAFSGGLPDALRHMAAQLSAAPQAPVELPADPDGRKIVKGDRVLIEHRPESPWLISAIAGGEQKLPELGSITLEGLTPKQVEYVVRQRLVGSGSMIPTNEIRVLVTPDDALAPADPALKTVFIRGTVHLAASVVVQGPVRRPGEYQLDLDQMTLMKAITAAGGFSPDAGPDVWILRPPAGSTRVVTMNNPNAVKSKYVRQELLQGLTDPPLQAYDTVWVSIAEFFFVSGEVNSTGRKIWEPNMTVAGAITAAGGLTPRASVSRSQIRRRNARGTFDTIDNLESETPVLPRDELMIRPR